MKIGFANDHSALEMKRELIPYLQSKGYEIVNFGTDTTQAVDYPETPYAIMKWILAWPSAVPAWEFHWRAIKSAASAPAAAASRTARAIPGCTMTPILFVLARGSSE